MLPRIATGILAAAVFLPAFGGEEMRGPATRTQILTAVPEWESVMASYQPNPAAVGALHNLAQPALIEVYFGSWCSDSKDHVSALFKVLDLADNPLLQTAYIALPRDKAERAKYVAANMEIVKLPTFIVLVDSKEKGRLIERPTATVEDDLAAILARGPARVL